MFFASRKRYLGPRLPRGARRVFAMGLVVLLASVPVPAHTQVEPPAAPDTDPSSEPAPSGKLPEKPTRTISAEDAQRERDRLEPLITRAFADKDYVKAEALLRELIPLDHANFVPWYNLACALSKQGKADDAMRMLEQAIARGFLDRRQMDTDDHLAAVRQTPDYQRLTTAWRTMLEARTKRIVDDATRQFRIGDADSPYRLERDDAKGLVFVTAFDAKLFAHAKAELDRLNTWWTREVLPAPAGTPPGATTNSDAPTVLVVLPTRADFLTWALSRYGERALSIGGAYDHDQRRLVAMDLGATLRHEFWHVLHYRDMEARTQRHPHWVMEGLCSLVEDVDVGPKGELRALPSWRTNMARRLARAGSLTPWDLLMTLDAQRFNTTRPLAMYAQSRAIFMFLVERGKLRAWYGAFVDTYREDPSGRAAFVRTFGQPLKATELEFRAWCKALPEVADKIGEGPANLPFDVDPGGGDGPTVAPIDLTAVLLPSSPGTPPRQSTELRAKDVITSIDNKPVRDLNDLARVLGTYEAGAIVTVEYRRGGKHGVTRVKLVPPRR